MTIGRKIALAFVVILLSFAAISAVVSNNTVELIDNNQWVIHTRAVLERLESVVRGANRSEASVLSYLITGDESSLAASASARGRADEAVRNLATLTQDNPTQQSRIADLKRHIARYYEELDALVLSRQRGEANGAIQDVARSAYRPELDAMRLTVTEMEASEESLLASRAAQADDAATNSLRVIRWGGLSTIALCLVVGFLLTIAIVRPVRVLLTGAAEIGAGNLRYRTVTGTSDELGSLGKAFNAMADNLGSTMVTADTEKQARLRVESLLKTIAETAVHLVSATSEIVAATTQQAAGAQEQVAAVAQTVTTVDEVVQSAEQARERARTVANIAVESVKHGKTGREVVQDSLRAMEDLRELVERTAVRTLELGEHAQAIDSVIEGVTEIAEQTNILALNAAMEGARAGESGQPFRVVAARVKTLAGESKQAADSARHMLRDVQNATSGLLILAEECNDGVVAASKVIVRADASLSALASIIDRASEAAVQIVASAGQQATGTAQIHEAMKQINAVTVQNLSSTRQMEKAARDLSALGGRLRDRVDGAVEPSSRAS
jgi:methyl-accepting chemotaxis protein